MDENLRMLLHAYRQRIAIDGTHGAFNAQALEYLDAKILEAERQLGFTPLDPQAVVDEVAAEAAANPH